MNLDVIALVVDWVFFGTQTSDGQVMLCASKQMTEGEMQTISRESESWFTSEMWRDEVRFNEQEADRRFFTDKTQLTFTENHWVEVRLKGQSVTIIKAPTYAKAFSTLFSNDDWSEVSDSAMGFL